MSKHTSSNSILSNESSVYFILSSDDVLLTMNKIIAEMAEVLGFESKTTIRLLLNHFNWDKDTLTDRYWEDPEKLFRLLKIPDPTSMPSFDSDPLSPSSAAIQSKNNSLITCRTCQCDKPSKQFYSLKCAHQHCLVCWQQYLESNISSSLNQRPISCLSRCDQIIEDEEIFRLISNSSLKQRYQRIIINAYVESNRLARWCPGNSCQMIIQLESTIVDDARMITCDDCQFIFCFRCSREWHDPIQCTLLASWEKKNQDESMTGQWLQVHTKTCPKCASNIEKNGGCNHMTCRKPGCGHEFCWICLGRWSDHASHQCNVYRSKDETTNQHEARANLDRYMHYFTRYHAHQQSLRLEEKLVERVSEHKKALKADSKSYTNERALDRAVDVLRSCRSTLKFTYAFAFYLYPNNQAEVFEQNQADLERATEALSRFLEEEMDATADHMAKLMDKSSYCFDRRRTLLNHCREGYREHYWAGLHPY